MSITAGTYKARAIGPCVLGESKEKGTPFIELYFVITSGPNEGQQVRWSSYFTDTAGKDGMTVAGRTIKAMQTMGWQGDDLGEFANGELHGLGDNEVGIVVELETYEREGEVKSVPRVKWVNAGGGYLSTEQAMDRGAAASFAARMRGLVHSVKAKSPPPAAKAAPKNGSAPLAPAASDFPDSDEIPF